MTKMDTELCITLQQLGGNLVPVQSKLSDSVRSVIEAAQISVPPNSQLICLSRGAQLHLDLSLSANGVQPNDTIVVMCQNRKKGQRRLTDPEVTSEYTDRQQDLLNEAVRVSDVVFVSFEHRYYRGNTAFNIYRSFLEQQDVERYMSEEEEETVIGLGEKRSISSDPLPPCWKEPSEFDPEEYE